MTGQLALPFLDPIPVVEHHQRRSRPRRAPRAARGFDGVAYSPRRGHIMRVRTVRVRLGGLL